MKRTTQSQNRKLWTVAFAATATLLTVGCGGATDDQAAGVGEAAITDSQRVEGLADNEPDLVIDEPTDTTDDEPDAVTDTDLSEEEQALAFAECMRDEGVDWPDPTTEADGSINLGAGQVGFGSGARIDIRSADVQAGIGECRDLVAGASFLPNAGRGLTVEVQDDLLQFANCLRDEGVDVDDPDLSSGPAGVLAWDFDPADPANSDALAACQSLFAGLAG